MSMTTEITMLDVVTEITVAGGLETSIDQVGTSLVVETELSTGIRGIQGMSPYEEWLALGNTGTYEDFLSTIAALASGAAWSENSW